MSVVTADTSSVLKFLPVEDVGGHSKVLKRRAIKLNECGIQFSVMKEEKNLIHCDVEDKKEEAY